MCSLVGVPRSMQAITTGYWLQAITTGYISTQGGRSSSGVLTGIQAYSVRCVPLEHACDGMGGCEHN